MAILQRTCVLCRREGPALCAGCARRLPPPPTTRVRGVGRVDALFAYEGTGADVVRGLKFHDARRVVAVLADGMAELISRRGTPQAVTWLPTSAVRRRDRGFDQAELLARGIARRLGVRAVGVFHRRPGPPQTGRSWGERADNVAFALTPRAPRLKGPIAIVDDVCTTGATMRAARAVLPASLAERSTFAALARTP